MCISTLVFVQQSLQPELSQKHCGSVWYSIKDCTKCVSKFLKKTLEDCWSKFFKDHQHQIIIIIIMCPFLQCKINYHLLHSQQFKQRYL